MRKRDIQNKRKIDIKSLGIVVGIILLFSSTIAMAFLKILLKNHLCISNHKIILSQSPIYQSIMFKL